MLNNFISAVQLHTDIEIAKALKVEEMHKYDLSDHGRASTNKSSWVRNVLVQLCGGDRALVQEQLRVHPSLAADFVLCSDASGQPVHPHSPPSNIDTKHAVIIRSARLLSIEFSPESRRLSQDVRMQISMLHRLGYNVIVVLLSTKFEEVKPQLTQALTCEEKRRRPVQFIPDKYSAVASKIDLEAKLI